MSSAARITLRSFQVVVLSLSFVSLGQAAPLDQPHQRRKASVCWRRPKTQLNGLGLVSMPQTSGSLVSGQPNAGSQPFFESPVHAVAPYEQIPSKSFSAFVASKTLPTLQRPPHPSPPASEAEEHSKASLVVGAVLGVLFALAATAVIARYIISRRLSPATLLTLTDSTGEKSAAGNSNRLSDETWLQDTPISTFKANSMNTRHDVQPDACMSPVSYGRKLITVTTPECSSCDTTFGPRRGVTAPEGEATHAGDMHPPMRSLIDPGFVNGPLAFSSPMKGPAQPKIPKRTLAPCLSRLLAASFDDPDMTGRTTLASRSHDSDLNTFQAARMTRQARLHSLALTHRRSRSATNSLYVPPLQGLTLEPRMEIHVTGSRSLPANAGSLTWDCCSEICVGGQCDRPPLSRSRVGAMSSSMSVTGSTTVGFGIRTSDHLEQELYRARERERTKQERVQERERERERERGWKPPGSPGARAASPAIVMSRSISPTPSMARSASSTSSGSVARSISPAPLAIKPTSATAILATRYQPPLRTSTRGRAGSEPAQTVSRRGGTTASRVTESNISSILSPPSPALIARRAREGLIPGQTIPTGKRNGAGTRPVWK